METESVKIGQSEIGIVHHQGNTFSAGGSSVNGNRVTGYVKGSSITRWNGETMIDCRSWIVREYCNEFGDDSYAMVFRLTHGRAIVGYSLGDGMLFRGELVTLGRGASDRDFERLAESESEYWLRIDQEEYERDLEEQRQEYLAEELAEWEDLDSL